MLMCFERKFTNYFIKTKVLKVLRIEKPTGFAGWLKIRSKTHSKEPRFILKTQKKRYFSNFRLLDYLSSALTVGYTIFVELCRYYFAVRFQKIFE